MGKILSNESISKRNYYLMILEGAMFNFAASLIDGNSVVSVFINEMTGSTSLAGLAAALRSGMPLITQFFFGMYIMRIRDLGRSMRISAYIFRWAIALMVPVLLLGVTGQAAAWCLVFCIAMLFVGDGFCGLMWTEIGARTVEPKKRAAIQGYQQVFAGAAALGVAFIVKAIKDSPNMSLSVKYAWIFGMCGAAFFVNILCLLPIRDFPRDKAPDDGKPKVRFGEYVKGLYKLFISDKNFRKIMYGRILYIVSSMISSFIVLFGTGECNLTATQASSLFYVQVVGQIIGGFFWVKISKKWGNTLSMVMSHVFPIIIAAVGIASSLISAATGMSLFIPVCVMIFLTGINLSGWIGYVQRVIDTVAPENRTGFLVLQSLLLFPFTFTSLLAGVIVDLSGFIPVFIIVLVSSALGLFITGSVNKHASKDKIMVETAR